MIEEQYLVYQCYGVTQGEKEEDIDPQLAKLKDLFKGGE